MTSVLGQLSIENLAHELVKPRLNCYSEDSLGHFIDPANYHSQNIHQIVNKSGFVLKSTLVTRRKQPIDQQADWSQCIDEGGPAPGNRSKCVVYLHGLGSNRLQALSLLQNMPPDYSLFTFDCSGCGKSEGTNITYGLREAEDLEPIIAYLHKHRGVQDFVLWGRSMGAVTAILYCIGLAKQARLDQQRGKQLARIRSVVLDSPFCSFHDIVKQVAKTRVKLPQFLLNWMLGLISTVLDRIMVDESRGGRVYNPAGINLAGSPIDMVVPAVFVHSKADEIVPSEHSEKIMRCCRSKFRKVVMESTLHNEPRPAHVIKQIFEILSANQRRTVHMHTKSQISLASNVQLSRTKSTGSIKKGIHVQSKQRLLLYHILSSQPAGKQISCSTIYGSATSKVLVNYGKEEPSFHLKPLKKKKTLADSSKVKINMTHSMGPVTAHRTAAKASGNTQTTSAQNSSKKPITGVEAVARKLTMERQAPLRRYASVHNPEAKDGSLECRVELLLTNKHYL